MSLPPQIWAIRAKNVCANSTRMMSVGAEMKTGEMPVVADYSSSHIVAARGRVAPFAANVRNVARRQPKIILSETLEQANQLRAGCIDPVIC